MIPTASDLWSTTEPLLDGVARPARYIDHEWGARHTPDASYRVALVYPDTYELGMANQALAILYDRLNAMPDVAAERAFVPWKDMGAAMRAAGVPLSTLESSIALAACDLIGITLPYELTYPTVLEVLDLAGLPLRASERSASDPLVIGGGPCAFNPEPIAPFFDAILIGEGEDAITEIVEAHRDARDRGLTREDTLRELARVSGMYVPTLYAPVKAPGAVTTHAVPIDDEVASKVVRRVLADFGSLPAPEQAIVPFMEAVHDRANIEILRGCTRGCRFCQAGMVYRPVRERPADDIVRDVLASLRCTGYEEVSLTSLSSADHSQIEEVVRRLTRRLEGTGVSIALPSLRVDAFSLELAQLIADGRKTGLTFAPEAGTQRLRDAINKNVTDEDLLSTIETAFRAGWHRVKLYFMLGLPTETDEDIAGIGALVQRVVDTARIAVEPSQRSAVKISVSVSTLVPKAHTPFQWDGQATQAEITRRQSILRASMPRKGVHLAWHEADISFVEAVLARGGREVADAIEAAWRSGAAFCAWSDEFSTAVWDAAFEQSGIDAVRTASESRSADDRLPWSHIDSGVSETFLLTERRRADEAQTTTDCSFDACTGCGVCQALGVDIALGGAARG